MDYNEITKEIFRSGESLYSFIENIKRSKEKNLKLFFDGLNNYLKTTTDSTLKELIKNGDLELKDILGGNLYKCISNYYIEPFAPFKDPRYPFVSILTKFNNTGIWLSIRLEVFPDDGRCYLGLVTHGENGKQIAASSSISNKYFKEMSFTAGRKFWWFYRRAIEFNEEPINFLYPNESYALLFNDESGENNRALLYAKITKNILRLYTMLKQHDDLFNMN